MLNGPLKKGNNIATQKFLNGGSYARMQVSNACNFCLN